MVKTQVCASALGDIDGCRLLADTPIELRCALKTYQTFAAGMSMGGDFCDAV